MQVSDFDFQLPDELIARFPTPERTGSRLLHLIGHSQVLHHRQFTQIETLLHPGDLLVFNNTKVIPARLFGQKESGGKIEILIERLTSQKGALAHIKASNAPKPGTRLIMEGGYSLQIETRKGSLYTLTCPDSESLITHLEQHGHMPLPPYLNRTDQASDKERYQTVFAQTKGAVAAPTAGLHFDHALLDRLRQKGINQAFITLHVGAGTFQPIKTERVEEHVMHHEWLEVNETVVEQIRQTKANGGRVIAVGTTCVRSLETASQTGQIKPFSGDTNIFIYPGYRFNTVDAMLTNFHLPKSTLIMLVSAFAGHATVMNAYREAIKQKYRFYSYGDAMFIEHEKTPSVQLSEKNT